LLIDSDVVMRGGGSWRGSEWLGEAGRNSEKLGGARREGGGRVQKKLPMGLDSFL
jgi:hypothetical protein